MSIELEKNCIQNIWIICIIQKKFSWFLEVDLFWNLIKTEFYLITELFSRHRRSGPPFTRLHFTRGLNIPLEFCSNFIFFSYLHILYFCTECVTKFVFVDIAENNMYDMTLSTQKYSNSSSLSIKKWELSLLFSKHMHYCFLKK